MHDPDTFNGLRDPDVLSPSFQLLGTSTTEFEPSRRRFSAFRLSYGDLRGIPKTGRSLIWITKRLSRVSPVSMSRSFPNIGSHTTRLLSSFLRASATITGFLQGPKAPGMLMLQHELSDRAVDGSSPLSSLLPRSALWLEIEPHTAPLSSSSLFLSLHHPLAILPLERMGLPKHREPEQCPSSIRPPLRLADLSSSFVPSRLFPLNSARPLGRNLVQELLLRLHRQR